MTFEDLETVDPELYRGLVYFKENAIDDEEETDIFFTVEHQFAGQNRTVELVPGGASVMLTEANKHQYITLMTRCGRSSIRSFVHSFVRACVRAEVRAFVGSLVRPPSSSWTSSTTTRTHAHARA